MKLKVLVANEEALKTLINAKLDNAQLAWDLAESVEIVEKAMKKFHDKRSDYIKSHGKPSKANPENYDLDDPVLFQKEVVKLLEIDVKISFPNIKIEDLKGIKVTSVEMGAWKALGIIKLTK